MDTIYTVIDPITQVARYVGHTRIPLNERLNKHLTKARSAGRKAPIHQWMASMLERGIRPVIVPIDKVASSEALDLEQEYIKVLSASEPLLNVHYNTTDK